MEKIAVILVETYSAKLYIAAASQDNYFVVQDIESEPIQLSLEMDDDHFLKKPQIDSTIRVLKNFRKICELHGVTRTIAVANLFRETKPKNIYSFFDEVFASCGFRFSVLAPEEQNSHIYSGSINSYDIPKGVVAHLSADGLHIVEYNRRSIVNQAIFNFGPMTLLNMYPFEELGKDVALTKIKKYIATQLGDYEWLKKVDEEFQLVISGDYALDLAKMIRKHKKYPLDRDDGLIVDKSEVEYICNQVCALELDKTKKIKIINEPRADVFAVSLHILQAIINEIGKDKATICSNAFIKGVMYAEVIPSTLDRPISDVLGFSVIAETSFHDVGSEKHNEQVYNLAILLFKQLKVLHKLPRNYVKILRVAAFMHDVGKRINFLKHAKYSYDVIMGADIFGVTHRELVLAAFTASLHQGGDIAMSEWVKYKDLFEEDDASAVSKLGVILRIAEALDRTKNSIIVDVTCDILGDSVIMKTIKTADNTYELQKAQEACKDFEKYFCKKIEIL
ncbi:MAG: hypothetical protein IKC11_00555 [Clostridia bacterium]|nr:hypothetical protein [Clostridia bacterium]